MITAIFKPSSAVLAYKSLASDQHVQYRDSGVERATVTYVIALEHQTNWKNTGRESHLKHLIGILNPTPHSIEHDVSVKINGNGSYDTHMASLVAKSAKDFRASDTIVSVGRVEKNTSMSIQVVTELTKGALSDTDRLFVCTCDD